MKNHRVVVSRHGGPEALQVVEEDLAEPGAGEVRVKLFAAGVSAYDLMHRCSGLLPGTPKVPFTLGLDIVGEVDALGSGVSTVEPGRRVAAGPLSEGGGYAAFVCLPEGELVPVPDGVDSAEAVCVVSDYLTADLMLHEAPRSRAVRASWFKVRQEVSGLLCSNSAAWPSWRCTARHRDTITNWYLT